MYLNDIEVKNGTGFGWLSEGPRSRILWAW